MSLGSPYAAQPQDLSLIHISRDDAKHLREQLDKQQAETASLTRELDELRSLNDTLRLQAEQLRQEAEEARQAKSAYAPYLPAISKIYGMACESAGNIAVSYTHLSEKEHHAIGISRH